MPPQLTYLRSTYSHGHHVFHSGARAATSVVVDMTRMRVRVGDQVKQGTGIRRRGSRCHGSTVIVMHARVVVVHQGMICAGIKGILLPHYRGVFRSDFTNTGWTVMGVIHCYCWRRRRIALGLAWRFGGSADINVCGVEWSESRIKSWPFAERTCYVLDME